MAMMLGVPFRGRNLYYACCAAADSGVSFPWTQVHGFLVRGIQVGVIVLVHKDAELERVSNRRVESREEGKGDEKIKGKRGDSKSYLSSMFSIKS